jgi:uncharacterized membrane protein
MEKANMSRNTITQSFLTTLVAGVLFLVPVGIAGIVLVKVVGVMMLVAQPMADWLPVDSIGGVALANIIALLALIVVCFLAGLLARQALASTFVTKLESRVLVNIPGYLMIKSLVTGFDSSKTEGLKPVALKLGSAERIGFEIQKLQDGRSVVFIPSAPCPFSGITQVLPPEQVCYLDVPINMINEATENFGHGMEELLAARKGSS